MSRSRLILVLVAVALAAAMIVWSLARPALPERLPEDQLVLMTATGEHRFTVEIAADDPSRARGLMFRTEMPADHGMLFDYFTERLASMWMENTYIPLDMVFIRANGQVSSVARNTTPLSRNTVSATAPVRFVLELNAGTADRIGLAPGDRMRHARVAH